MKTTSLFALGFAISWLKFSATPQTWTKAGVSTSPFYLEFG